MLVLSMDEVNLNKIMERFEEIGPKEHHAIDIGYFKDLGSSVDEMEKLYSHDWNKASEEIEKKYKDRDNVDLIIIEPYKPECIDFVPESLSNFHRFGHFYAHIYKMKKL